MRRSEARTPGKGGTVARSIPVLVHAALLFWLSAQPDLRLVQDPLLDLIVRKVGHAAAYALLALLAAWAIGGIGGSPRRTLLVVAGVALYAVSDEIHQAFVPGRSMSALDVVIDAAGGGMGVLMAHSLEKLRSRSHT